MILFTTIDVQSPIFPTNSLRFRKAITKKPKKASTDRLSTDQQLLKVYKYDTLALNI